MICIAHMHVRESVMWQMLPVVHKPLAGTKTGNTGACIKFRWSLCWSGDGRLWEDAPPKNAGRPPTRGVYTPCTGHGLGCATMHAQPRTAALRCSHTARQPSECTPSSPCPRGRLSITIQQPQPSKPRTSSSPARLSQAHTRTCAHSGAASLPTPQPAQPSPVAVSTKPHSHTTASRTRLSTHHQPSRPLARHRAARMRRA